MAVAAALIKGLSYRITAGPLTGAIVQIVDSHPIPDGGDDRAGAEHQRKILVSLDGAELWMLPRLIDSTPWRTTQTVVAQPVVQPVVTNVTDSPVAPVTTVQHRSAALTTVQQRFDAMDPALDSFRPDTRKVAAYQRRTMQNGMSDVDYLLAFTGERHRAENEGRPANIMLKGDTQGGKTLLVNVLACEWAKRLGLSKPVPVFTLSGSGGITDYDLFGSQTAYSEAGEQERLVWLSGIMDMAARTSHAIAYLDEINAIPERFTSSLHPLLDHRHQFVNRFKAVPTDETGSWFMPEVVTTSVNLWVIGTYNEGYRGMGSLNEAFINRFRHIEWGYSAEVEKSLVPSAAILLLASALRQARSESKLRTPVGTAALQRLWNDVNTFGVGMALDILVGQFLQQEREIVRAIIEDRSIAALIGEEIK